jgi:hypothetical protein
MRTVVVAAAAEDGAEDELQRDHDVGGVVGCGRVPAHFHEGACGSVGGNQTRY